MSRRKTNEEFQEELKKLRKQGHDVYSDDIYINNNTLMWFYCSKGHKWQAISNNIFAGTGCPYCANKKVLIGFNDLWTTRPDIAKLLKNPEDGYKYLKSSRAKVDFICPYCNSVVKKKIAYVYERGLCCEMCSDGVSYPNKLIRQILKQLQIGFVPEYCPEWGHSKQYDCYFKYQNKEYVVEMDGVQHYIEIDLFKQSLEEIKNNDQLKMSLAISNGVNIIRIDCMESNLEYIKNSILTSELNDILNLSEVDWDLCNQNAQKSLVKEVCDLYMSGMSKINDICTTLHLHRKTTRRYLKIGAKFGWCNYTSKTTKSVAVFDLNQHELYCFDGINECSKCMEDIYGTPFYRGYIRNSMNTNKPYKGFIFKPDNHNTKLM